jgi:glutamate 5-kinase
MANRSAIPSNEDGPMTTRLIVKVGSSLLVGKDGTVRRDWLASLAHDIAARVKDGTQVAVVSSGAIALGARRLGLAKGGRATLEDAQAAAAVGQIALAGVWAELLGAEGLVAAQMLVTLDDLEDRRRYLNAAATLDRLMGLGVVPVINENDSVATAEIRFGDNDRLAARIAAAAQADAVVLLSDVDGIYTADPSRHPDARHIARIERIDAALVAMAGPETSSGMGSGGMASKVEAARIANGAGVDLIIASGKDNHPLRDLFAAKRHSRFVAPAKARSRKAWLVGRLTVKGRITIDAGAANALKSGSSLLAVGATGVSGQFSRGDVIDIILDGAPVARGLSEYDSGDAMRIAGMKSDAIGALLGSPPRAALIHRDHMVIL